jgi:dTDP-4-dehydrorhamnose reductase
MNREPHLTTARLELWAGVECTVNRVGEEYFDQLERNGHAWRDSDLERFAALGISAMRYPVLWERTAPDGLEQADWTWADARLSRLRELGVRPVVGLVHHGSGPRRTSLVDPEFPEKLAAYARAVAERYPWVEDYTPVNEPLTTARFSGLYGHWYPHGRDDRTFLRALITQCRAVALAMDEIRRVNPSARLVQTEDLGKIYSTRRLRYQAEFENERRWLSLDLLTGRIGASHPLWNYLRSAGVGEGELQWFAEHPCVPDILGINHYLTSERFLDERVERYPECTRGGNGTEAYADVEAVRVCAEGTAGPRVLLREAWERYRLPMAVTEAHLGCTREEQMRWFLEVWEAAQELRAEGVPLRAVTAWALLGSYDWNYLLTCAAGHYEPGVFDARTPDEPRPTALAAMLRDLAAGREHEHPALNGTGWWRRLDLRLIYPKRRRSTGRYGAEGRGVELTRGAERPLLITGASGTLGNAFARLCQVRGLSYHLLSRSEMDIADAGSVARAFERFEPWAVVNAAGYVRVDDAEREPELCMRENAEGAARLAEACARAHIPLLAFSSDLVFDGAGRSTPYVESDAPAPLNVYGRSKAEMEARVLAIHPSALVVRCSAFFGPWDEYNFITIALRELSAGRNFVAAEDAHISPTYVPDLVNESLNLLIDGERGLWHLANPGAVTWAELARTAAALAGLDERGVIARPTSALKLPAARPSYSVLGSERGVLLPPLADALARYMDERGRAFAHQRAGRQSTAS